MPGAGMKDRCGRGVSGALLVVACLAGCGDERPPPVPVAITPGTVGTTAETPARVTGRDFFDAVTVVLDGTERPALEDAWAIRIGDADALDVTRVDETQLTLRVPAGLPVGTHDLTVIAPDGQSGTLPDALRVFDDATTPRRRVSVETEADGSGAPIRDRTLRAGETLLAFAVLRSEDGAFDGAAEVTWSVEGGIGVADAGPSASVVLEARAAGVGALVALHPTATSGRTGDLTVVAGDATRLIVEDQPGGVGAEVDGRELFTGATLELHAVERDGFGNFVADASATWEVSGAVGAVAPLSGATTTFEATEAGTGRVTATAAVGSDATGDLVVRSGAALQASFLVPPSARLDVPFEVRLRVDNGGASGATGVAPCPLTLTGGAVATVDAGPTPARADLAPSDSSTFVFTLTATAPGSLTLDSCATGVDATTSVPVASGPATGSLDVAGVSLVAADPFGDGSRRASVFRYDGRLGVGHDDSGRRTLLMEPDGSRPESLRFRFSRDPVDGESRNRSTAPYPSIGRAGCVEDSAACGPDNEDGRGLSTSEVIGGVEWLVIGGARIDGDLDYVYLSDDRDGDGDLDVSFVDLSTALGGRTHALTAVHAIGADLYLGFTDDGGDRPYLLRLSATPTPPGLDASDTEVTDLRGKDLDGLDDGNPAMIDGLWEFADRLYLANAGAWYRATRARPGPADANPGHWREITPTADEYAARTSLETSRESDLESSDRAVPFMAAYNGLLYAARNTTAGP
jgi:hypothetical protein